MKRSSIRFVYYLAYVVAFPILKFLYSVFPELKKSKIYEHVFKHGITYNAFRIYMADFKQRDKLGHGILLICPLFTVAGILYIIFN